MDEENQISDKLKIMFSLLPCDLKHTQFFFVFTYSIYMPEPNQSFSFYMIYCIYLIEFQNHVSLLELL